MIPWCFAYDKVNYARYLSAYFAQMTNLPESSSLVYEAFKAGQFSVQMSSSNRSDSEQGYSDTRRPSSIQPESRCCEALLLDSRTSKCILRMPKRHGSR